MNLRSITLLTESDVRRCVGLDQNTLCAIEEAFTYLTEGAATVPAPMMIDVPERIGEVHVKAARIHRAEAFAVKIASGFFKNREDGLPIASGLMVLLSANTGFPVAVILDNGYLTRLRTALAGAIVAKYLARKEVKTVGIIGAGNQGRYQIKALRLVRQFSSVLVFDIVPDVARQYAVEMSAELGTMVAPIDSIADLVQESDVVISATPSRSPLIMLEYIHAGLHITAIGADGPGKQELDPRLLARADRLCCDRKSQCFHSGELQHGLKYGSLTERSEILELGEITAGRKPGRRNDTEFTVCDLTGVGVQDTAIALMAYREARQGGLGTKIVD